MSRVAPISTISYRDCQDLGRARETLDAIYDTLMAINLTVKPILVTQLRSVHATVYGLEQKGSRPFLIRMLRRGRIKPSELPEWFHLPEPPPPPAAAEKSEEQG
jgi:hypothetical protein